MDVKAYCRSHLNYRMKHRPFSCVLTQIIRGNMIKTQSFYVVQNNNLKTNLSILYVSVPKDLASTLFTFE